VRCVPEDLKTYITRLFEHALKQLDLAKRALEVEEYDTFDFLLSVSVNDLVKIRSVISGVLRFKPQEK